MDLMGGYLLVVLILFSVNFALLAGNFKFNNIKLIAVSLMAAFISFALIMIPQSLNQSDFLLNNFGYLFLIGAVILFLIVLSYLKKNNLKTTIYSVIVLFIVLTLCLASQSRLTLFDTLIYSLLAFILFFFVYQITKLLTHAKRPYPVIVGEYMSLFSVLMLIFGLTYNSTLNLDYGMFDPFLILTPTYLLIYFVVGICVVIAMGALLHEFRGGN